MNDPDKEVRPETTPNILHMLTPNNGDAKFKVTVESKEDERDQAHRHKSENLVTIALLAIVVVCGIIAALLVIFGDVEQKKIGMGLLVSVMTGVIGRLSASRK